MKYLIRTSCLGLALLFASGQSLLAQNAGFGTLEATPEAAVKAQAAAWLKSAGKTDAASTQQFDAIWSQKNRTALDRLADTFALGNADAAKLLADARNVQMAPSIEVPKVLTNAEQPVFFRANLALAYARILSGRRVHDEGLDALKPFQPDQVIEPAGFLFHRAVCEHALLLKAETDKSIARLLTDALDAPDRYKTVSLLMLYDMQTWKDKDLGAVARKMERIEGRLQLAKGGPVTQKLQKEVVLRLDELIKEAENKAKKKQKEGDPKPGDPKPGDPKPGDQECPDGGEPKPGDQPGPITKNDNKKPAPDTILPNVPPGDGRVDPAQVRKLQEQWGTLPPRERERLLQQLTQGMSPSHRQAIENYFHNIAQVSSKRR